MCTTEQQPRQLGLSDKNHPCACSTGTHQGGELAEGTAVGEASLVREHFVVGGMTCGQCVTAVTDEVTLIDGVRSVSIDLNAGGSSWMVVVSSKPITVDEMRDAVTEAGYELVTD
ncbi:MAG TPA: heavy-metal-associated domain-containing protein [Glaciihabitans sp.]|jgi:copper chaperone CopZ|nr:heavy-metal-associated domain-containing protein [Glaciihabitans sp.]